MVIAVTATNSSRPIERWPCVALSRITIQTGDSEGPSTLIIVGAEPIRQPIAFGGLFVMNSRAEIQQAYVDLHSGKFGGVPQQARLQYR